MSPESSSLRYGLTTSDEDFVEKVQYLIGMPRLAHLHRVTPAVGVSTPSSS
jgi:hypothetical protein